MLTSCREIQGASLQGQRVNKQDGRVKMLVIRCPNSGGTTHLKYSRQLLGWLWCLLACHSQVSLGKRAEPKMSRKGFVGSSLHLVCLHLLEIISQSTGKLGCNAASSL